MKKTNLLISLLMAMLLVVGCEQTNDPEAAYGTLEIKVNIPSANARDYQDVVIQLNDAEYQDSCDAFGLVKFEDIPVGDYEIIAYSSNYGSAKKSIRLGKEELKSEDMELIRGVMIVPRVMGEARHVNNLETSNFAVDDSVNFAVRALDSFSERLDFDFKIESNLDGELYSGKLDSTGTANAILGNLTKGIHEIKFKVTNHQGYTGSDKITLRYNAPKRCTLLKAEYTGESVDLEWTEYEGDDFRYYEIVFREDYYPDDINGTVVRISDKSVTTFTDSVKKINNHCYYSVLVYNTTGYSASNNLYTLVPTLDTFLSLANFALVHPTLPYMYIVSDEQLMVYNYDDANVVINKTINGLCKFIDLQENGYGLELYVPTTNGDIRILDPETLDETERIKTGVSLISAEADGKGNVVATTSASDYRIRSYSRENLEIIDSLGLASNSRVVVMEGKNKAVTVSLSSSNTLEYFEISDDGVFVNHVNLAYDNYRRGNELAICYSPGGEYFVTGNEATVFTADESFNKQFLVYEGYGDCLSLDFNESGSVIYAALQYRRYVGSKSFPANENLMRYFTIGYPKFVFSKGDEIITLETSDSYYSDNTYMHTFVNKYNKEQ